MGNVASGLFEPTPGMLALELTDLAAHIEVEQAMDAGGPIPGQVGPGLMHWRRTSPSGSPWSRRASPPRRSSGSRTHSGHRGTWLPGFGLGTRLHRVDERVLLKLNEEQPEHLR